MGLSIMKVVVGIFIQFLCSYSTFPLYALVTQMGSNMKKTIFEEQTMKALMNWRKTAREKKKLRDADEFLAQMSGDTTPSRGSSPVHLLHKQRVRSEDPPSAPASPGFAGEARDMYPVPVAPVVRPHGFNRMDPDKRRAASSSAIQVDIADSDFSFSVQR
jgi:mlo protein